MDDINKPIRVLHITEMLSAAGIESFIMNMYRRIDRAQVQFDFLVLRNQKEFYEDEVKTLGGNKFFIQSEKKNTLFRVLEESKQIEAFLKNHPYKIVHIHYTTPLRAPYLLAAKRAGVAVRIYHAHSAAVTGKSWLKLFIYDYYRKKISGWGTNWFACSEAAAEWVFTKKLVKSGQTKVIYNGIDVLRFGFNSERRYKTRNALGIEDDFVIVHTGRFLEQKNHKFIVEIFCELKKKCLNVKLLLIGTGKLVKSIKEQVSNLRLQKDILFLGVKSNVEDYLCAADCYLMPSLYEGLPVAAVEAQCSGLPCVFSENITQEVKLRKDVEFLSLDEPIDEWCNQLLRYKSRPRYDGTEDIVLHGYGIQDGANHLQNFYESAIE